MKEAPLPSITSPKEKISESFELKQDEKNYLLNIEIINQDIILNLVDLNEFMKEYEFKLAFNELKELNKVFSMLSSCQEFLDYMKALISNKKLLIKNTAENQMSIEFIAEYLLKQNIISFGLTQKKFNLELISQNLYKKVSSLTKNLKNLDNNYQEIVSQCNNIKETTKKIQKENKLLKEENKLIKEENKIIREENKNIKEEIKNVIERMNNLENIINSSKKEITELKKVNNNNIAKMKLQNLINTSIIETPYELDMLYSAIKDRMKKEVKEIKKIFQATRDGGRPEYFHRKCNNIPNTLILYRSVGNRRFGAFASKCWESNNKGIIDKNCFLFSLDNNKIFPPKNNNYYYLSNNAYNGPSFYYNNFFCLSIDTKDPIRYNSLKTYEVYHKEIFYGDENALSEDGQNKGVYAKEYEVFQVLF